MTTFYGILIPFLGTTLGAACVFFLRRALGDRLQRALTGFAAGVMVAASVWSLLIPAIDQSAALGRLVVPARPPSASGSAWLFLLLLDRVIPHLHQQQPVRPRARSTPAAAHDHDDPGRDAAQHPGGHGRRRRLRRIPDRQRPRSPPPERWRSRSASPSRIFPRGPSSPCRCAPRARAACAPSRAACSRASSSRSAQC